MALVSSQVPSFASSLALRQSRAPILGLLRHGSSRFEIPAVSALPRGFVASRFGFDWKLWRNGFQFSVNAADASENPDKMSDQDTDSVPMPIVLIDQYSDANATIVQLSFGDRLGALVDTMSALKNLGIHVIKGSVMTEDYVKQTKFFIMTLGPKVQELDMFEKIWLTIITNLLKYHPASSERLAMGDAFGIKAPSRKIQVKLGTIAKHFLYAFGE